ncbi:lipoprotein [Shimia sp. SDUM112013]|uniref:lipoprotein n=1 Tax=Shimia sp. SDUM112013 TaxID=3136160 RepID=UPI0032EDE452
MKKVIVFAVLAAALAACSTPRFSDPTLNGLQSSCSAGDMTACSELAHRVKAQ